jgi:glycosyltransferase involved in cell wall biosynthesis
MQLALLTNGLFPWVVGGIQKHTCNLVREWVRLGVDVTVYFCDDTAYPADGVILDSLAPSGDQPRLRLMRYQPKRATYFPFHHYVECYWDSVAMDRLMDKEALPADFIYIQGYHGLEVFRQKRRGKKYPPIGVNLHALNGWQDSWFSLQESVLKMIGRPFEWFSLRNCDVALSLSDRIDDIIRRVAPRTPIVRSAVGISPGWLGEAAGAPHKPLRLVFVGRNEKAKGLHLLCQALDSLAPQSRVELHIVSPIPPDHQLPRPWLEYHGGIRDEETMQGLLRGMDVLVNPSCTEGVPTVVLEGMASGLAIMATDVGATCDLVGNDNGWLITANSVESLRNALGESLRLDPVLLEAKKRASLERVKRHLWPKVAEDTLRNIEGFLRQKAASAP